MEDKKLFFWSIDEISNGMEYVPAGHTQNRTFDGGKPIIKNDSDHMEHFDVSPQVHHLMAYEYIIRVQM